MSNQNLPRYLYRALRPAEITAGNVLIPKAQKPFLEPARLPQISPFMLGDLPEHAVRAHQWDKPPDKQFETSGISTTPHRHRARHYAAKHKIIVKIDTATFDTLGIVAYHVVDCCHPSHISVPEDDEIILVYPNEHEFPKAIIIDVDTL